MLHTYTAPFAMSGSSPHSLLGYAPSPLHGSHTSSLCAYRGAMHNFLTVGATFTPKFNHRHRNGLLRSPRAYRTRSYPDTDDPDRQPHQCADLRPYQCAPDTSPDSYLHPLDIRFLARSGPDSIRPALTAFRPTPARTCIFRLQFDLDGKSAYAPALQHHVLILCVASQLRKALNAGAARTRTVPEYPAWCHRHFAVNTNPSTSAKISY
jgi:hypothetical protein